MVDIKTPDNLNEVVGELRTLVETKSKESHEYKEKLDKLSVAFEKAEKSQNDIAAKLAEKKASEKEMAKKLDELETKFYRPQGNGSVEIKSNSYIEFMDALGTQDKNLASTKLAKASELANQDYAMLANSMQKKYLRTDSNVEGGWMCPPEFDKEIQKKIIEISPIRQLARVSTMGMKSLNIILRNTLATATWEGEAEEVTANNSKYGNIEIVANRLSAEHDITYEMLNNGYYDVTAEITSDVSIQFARSEGEAFVSGNGIKRPFGFMNNALVATRTSAASASITFDDIKRLVGDLKAGYNPTFVLNRRTVAELSVMKNSVGAYLWQEGSTGEGVPSTLAGLPYVRVIDMPDIGSSTYPVALGDWKEAYRIVDRFGMYMIRDEYTGAGKHIIKLFFHKYTGGDVVKAEGIKKLRCGA